MNPRDEPINPTVDRVRRARRAIAEQCDYDIAKYVALLREMESRHPERIRVSLCPGRSPGKSPEPDR